MEIVRVWVNHFFGVFDAGGSFFVTFLTNFLPALIVLMTAMSTIRHVVGPHRAERWAAFLGGNIVSRYSLMPLVAAFFKTNPEAYEVGSHLPERYKPAFYDSTVSLVHPVLGIFPHVNPAEIFVWAGIAIGIQELGESYGMLALQYFAVGLVVIWIRGVVTQILTGLIAWRRDLDL